MAAACGGSGVPARLLCVVWHAVLVVQLGRRIRLAVAVVGLGLRRGEVRERGGELRVWARGVVRAVVLVLVLVQVKR